MDSSSSIGSFDPVNPQTIVAITAGREGNQPDAEGQGRLACLNEGLNSFPTAAGYIIGAYPDGKGVTFLKIYSPFFTQQYPQNRLNLKGGFDKSNVSVDNLSDLSDHLGLSPEEKKSHEIALCTYRNHFLWLRESLLGLGYENITLIEAPPGKQTSAFADKVLLWTTRHDRRWRTPLGLLLRWYVNNDAKKIIALFPASILIFLGRVLPAF